MFPIQQGDVMDSRLKDLAAQLEAHVVGRREFLRKAAVVTGGTAAGLKVLESMATAQSPTKLRVWLFKSYVTAGNDVLAKQVEAWASERKVQVDTDWSTFGDREQKFVAAIEAGNPPDMAEMNYQGPARYKPALRDVTKLAKDIAAARGGLLPYAERVVNVNGQFFGVARLAFPGGLFVRKDLLDAKGVKMPKVYDPDVVEMAKKCQDPAKDVWGFGQTLNRCDDGNGFMQNLLWDYGGSVWDKDGKLVSTNTGASLFYAMVAKKDALAAKTQVILTPGGPGGSFFFAGAYNWGIFQKSKYSELCEGPDPLGRGREALRGIHEGLHRPGRSRLQVARGQPVLEIGPELRGHDGQCDAQHVAGLSWPLQQRGRRGAGAVRAL